MPSINNNPSSANSDSIRAQLELRQQKAKQQYDKNTVEKPELSDLQPVRVRNRETKRWEPAHVVKKADTPRSYIVQRCAGGVPLRRNRQQIRATHEQWCSGEYINYEEFDDAEVGDGGQLMDSWEMVGSEPSPRSSRPQLDAREMVGSEPSPGHITNQQQQTDATGHGVEEAVVTGQRYPSRQRNRPDFYQAGP